MAIEKQWTSHGLDCMIRRIPYTDAGTEYFFNGYVRVPENNQFYCQGYNITDDLRVHGGITFAQQFNHPDCKDIEGWWLGFDTNHAGDMPHGRTKPPMELPWGGYEHAWTLEEVIAETERLAEQIADYNND